MKFHRLTIRNLTTITGEQVVDFDALFSQGSPLLIHGPTGAGKTTILDAITLALYNETARISEKDQGKQNQLKINDLKMNDPRQVVSHGASSASVELVFSTVVRGQRRFFRAGWSVERAAVRKGNPEKWSNTHRLLVELDAQYRDLQGGLCVSSSKPKEYGPVFHEVLGDLQCEQFRRSVLLAQGQFAALLTADATDRANMLESLTGTAEFREIGRRAHVAFVEAKSAVELLKAEMSGANLWSDEAIAENRRQQAAQKAEAERLATEEAAATAQVNWWKELAQREAAIESAHATATAAQQGFASLSAVREWSVRYFATSSLIKHHASFGASAALAEKHRSEAAALEPKLASLREQLAHAEPLQQSAAMAAEAARARNEAILAELPAVQALHAAAAKAAQQLEHARGLRDAALAASNAAASKLAQAHAAKTAQENKVAAARLASASSAGWRNRDADVAKLEQATAAWKSIVGKLPAMTKRQQALELAKVLEQAEAKLASERVATTKLEADHSTAALKVTEADERLAAAVTAVADAERQRDLLKQLASVEQHRHLLKAGEACALCGATEHPFAALPVSDRVREIEVAVSELEERIAMRLRRQTELSTAQGELHRIGGVLSQRRSQVKQAEATLLEATHRRDARAKELGLPAADLPTALKLEWDDYVAEQRVAEEGLVAASAWLPTPSLRSLELDCDARLKTVQEERFRAAAAATEVTNQEALLESASAAALEAETVAATTSEAAKVAAADCATAEAASNRARAATLARWDGKAPDQVVSASAAALTEAESHAATLAATCSSLQGSLKEEVARQSQLNAAADEAAGQAETARAQRDAGLVAAGRHLDDFIADLRTPEELSDAAQRLATADEKVRAAADGLNAAHSALEQHRASALPGAFPSADEAAEEVARLVRLKEEALAQLHQLGGSLRLALTQIEQQGDRKLALAAAEALFGKWKTIDDLIGGEKGGAFHKAAQALNLERVIRAANGWLVDLNRRYAFRQSFESDGSPSLEFHLVDAFHADAQRGVNLISGGESFLCSLALALGLASERGEKLFIETLLLDEGFGTLDSASLETAISTLEKLQEKKITVGIISHVELLRSRIETQLEVRRVAPGRSEILPSRCP